ncbi:MAG: RNA pseudouridine synthase [Saprospiraceae bacterium]
MRKNQKSFSKRPRKESQEPETPFIPSPLYDEIKLVGETDDFWVWHKPAGLLVEKSSIFPSLESFVYRHDSQSRKKPFVGVVHRLDRPVSGCVVMAKKKSILKILNELFRERQVEKTYLALVSPCPPDQKGLVENWLSKDQKEKKALVHKKEVQGSFKAILEYENLGKRDKGCLLEVHPKTGKYHQIRIQLATLGCPIVGDDKYGGLPPMKEETISLHAWKLKFRDPILKGKMHEFSTHLPGFANLI